MALVVMVGTVGVVVLVVALVATVALVVVAAILAAAAAHGIMVALVVAEDLTHKTDQILSGSLIIETDMDLFKLLLPKLFHLLKLLARYQIQKQGQLI